MRTLIVARELLRQDPSRQAGARDFVWRHVDDPDSVTRGYALRALGVLDGSEEIERLVVAAERGSSSEARSALSALDFRIYLAGRQDHRGLDAVQTSSALQGVCERRANPTVVKFCKTLTSVHREQ